MSLNGSKSEELQAAEKTVEFVEGLVDNIKARLNHPDAPVVDAMQRHRSTIEMLSGAAMALICVGHPMAEISVSMANRASQAGERALDDSVAYFKRLVVGLS